MSRRRGTRATRATRAQHEQRAFAAAAIVLLGLDLGCTPFTGSEVSPVDGDGGGVNTGFDAQTSLDSGVLSDSGALPCEKNLDRFDDTFATLDETSWKKEPGDGGTVTAVNRSLIATATVFGKGTKTGHPATIIHDVVVKPRAVRLEYAFRVNALSPYAEIGCELAVAPVGAATEDRLLLATTTASTAALKGHLELAAGGVYETSAASFTVGTTTINVTLEMIVLGDDTVSPSVRFGTDQAQPLPGFTPINPGQVRVTCGVNYMEPNSSQATVSIALDELHLSICPQ